MNLQHVTPLKMSFLMPAATSMLTAVGAAARRRLSAVGAPAPPIASCRLCCRSPLAVLPAQRRLAALDKGPVPLAGKAAMKTENKLEQYLDLYH
jgi:hypothetical protein